MNKRIVEKKFKKAIETIFYRDVPEVIIILVLDIIFMVLSLVLNAKKIALIITIISVIFLIIHIMWNIKLNVNQKFLWCKPSILCKNTVWIVQRTFCEKNYDGCPKFQFINEMISLLNNLQDGTICYCYTHEIIKKRIEKKYPDNMKAHAVCKKNLGKLEKKTRNKKCKGCKNRKTCLTGEKNVQFYTIKFIK